MIVFVIEYEESLVMEIVEEEELVIVINGESESLILDMEQKEEFEDIGEIGESDFLNCSGIKNGDIVSLYC